MIRQRHFWLGAVAVSCAMAGAAFGIRGAAADSNAGGSTASPPDVGQRFDEMRRHMGERMKGISARIGHMRDRIGALGIAAPAVHQEMVVPTDGGGFETVTIDTGTVRSSSDGTLTIHEGYDGKTYKDVTVQIPSGANVERNASSAQLSDLKSGDRVRVSRSPSATNVTAWDDAHAPAFPRIR